MSKSSLRRKMDRCVRVVRKQACTPKGGCKISPTSVCRAAVLGRSNPHKLDFPSEKGYNVKLSVYVPDTYDVSHRVGDKEHMMRAKETEKKLRDTFGGSTSVKGLGTWKDVDCPGGVCKDNLLIVQSAMMEEDWLKKDNQIKKYLMNKRKEWGQDCLTYEWSHATKVHPFEGLHFLCKKKKKG